MPQSVKIDNLEHYQSTYENKLVDFAFKENVNRRFMVGEKMDKIEAVHTIMMSNKLCTNNCDLMEVIWREIKGKPHKKDQTRKDDLDYFNNYLHEDSYIFDWGEIEW